MKLAATIGLSDAAAISWDVAVVGAGPAGAITARELARLDSKVLLIDKARFPRTKVCGCCLNPRSQSTLQSVGLENLAKRLGAIRINCFRISAGSHSAALPLDGTISLSRQALDTALVQAAIKAGAQFLPHTEARLGTTGDDGYRHLTLKREITRVDIRSKILVAADGVGSALMKRDDEVVSATQQNSRIGAGVVVDAENEAYQVGTIYMACGREGYVGLVRLEDHRLDIAAALDPASIKQAGGIGPVATRIIRRSQFPYVADLGVAHWQGTPMLTRHSRSVFAERVFLVGDAAGYVEPFTGEGIAWALAGGAALAPIARQSVDAWDPALGDQWTREYRALVGRRQWLCRMLAAGLRHPRLTGGVVTAVSVFPFLATPVLNLMAAKS